MKAKEVKYWLMLATDKGTWIRFKPETLGVIHRLKPSIPKAHWQLYKAHRGRDITSEVETYFRGLRIAPNRGWYKLTGIGWGWFESRTEFVGSV